MCDDNEFSNVFMEPRMVWNGWKILMNVKCNLIIITNSSLQFNSCPEGIKIQTVRCNLHGDFENDVLSRTWSGTKISANSFKLKITQSSWIFVSRNYQIIEAYNLWTKSQTNSIQKFITTLQKNFAFFLFIFSFSGICFKSSFEKKNKLNVV